MTGAVPRFHLAIPVDDLAAARSFYGDVLGCPEGRHAPTWIDFELFGHQLVVHLAESRVAAAPDAVGHVDGTAVPIPHFGVLLEPSAFHGFVDRARAAGLPFVIEPALRYPGEPAEQWTAFFLDPAGNALEFKAFTDDAAVFAR